MHVFTAVHWKLQETGPDSCNELLDADFLDKVKMSISWLRIINDYKNQINNKQHVYKGKTNSITLKYHSWVA